MFHRRVVKTKQCIQFIVNGGIEGWRENFILERGKDLTWLVTKIGFAVLMNSFEVHRKIFLFQQHPHHTRDKSPVNKF